MNLCIVHFLIMKHRCIFFLLSLIGGLQAGPVEGVAGHLRARAYEAAAAVAIPQGVDAQAGYLHLLSLHHAGKHEEVLTAAEQGLASGAWVDKARFLKAASLTKLKRHEEAETIYATAAAAAFFPERRDELVTALMAVAHDAVTPSQGAAGERKAPDWTVALTLCDKVLDTGVTERRRSEVMFQKARWQQAAGMHEAALALYHEWLLAYDSTWPRYDGEVVRYEGAATEAARRHLIECLLAERHSLPARAVADGYAKWSAGRAEVTADSRGDVAWLRVQTFLKQNIGAKLQPWQQNVSPVPTGQLHPQLVVMRETEVSTPLAEVRVFLTRYPSHKHASLASALVAELLEEGRAELEAIGAWQDFIGMKNFKYAGDSEEGKRRDEATGLTGAESLLSRQQAALYHTGKLYAGLKKPAEAVVQWKEYLRKYPHGKEWTAAQKDVVLAEYQLALEVCRPEARALAMERLGAFIQQYPLDERARQIYFIYGQFAYLEGVELERLAAEAGAGGDAIRPQVQEQWEKALRLWAELIAKYPQSEEAGLALYRTGVLLEEGCGREEEALAAFTRLTWSSLEGLAKKRADLLKQPSLGVATERVFRLREKPAVQVTARNLETLRVSLFPIDAQAYFRSRHRLGEIDLLDIDLIAPQRTWEVKLKDYKALRGRTETVDLNLPGGVPGAYVVRVESGEWQATTLVLQSDVDVWVESAQEELLVYAYNGERNQPEAGAEVLVTDGKKLIAQGKTAEDGVLRVKPEGYAQTRTVRVFVMARAGVAASALSIPRRPYAQAYKGYGEIVSDKAEYRLGDVVTCYGMRRSFENGSYGVKPDVEGWRWRAQLPNGRLLYEGPVVWDAMGMCRFSFQLPGGGASDTDYHVRIVHDKETLHRMIRVVEGAGSRALRIEALEGDGVEYQLGEVVKGRFALTWENGLPAAAVESLVETPDGRVTAGTTDAGGYLEYAFETATLPPGVGVVSLKVPSLPISGQRTLILKAVQNPVIFKVFPLYKIPQGEPIRIETAMRNTVGSEVAATVRVLQTRACKSSPVLEALPGLLTGAVGSEDVLVEEHMMARPGKLALGVRAPGEYLLHLVTHEGGTMRETKTAFTIMGGPGASSLQIYKEDGTLPVGSTLALRVDAMSAHDAALVTVHGQTFHSHKIVALKSGRNDMNIPITQQMAPNVRITVAAIRDGKAQMASQEWVVDEALNVELVAEGTGCRVVTKDALGNPVSARVLVSVSAGVERGTGGLAVAPKIPQSQTSLSLGSSVGMRYVGTSWKRGEEGVVKMANDQESLHSILYDEVEVFFSSERVKARYEKHVQANAFIPLGVVKDGQGMAYENTLREMPTDAVAPSGYGREGQETQESSAVGTPQPWGEQERWSRHEQLQTGIDGRAVLEQVRRVPGEAVRVEVMAVTDSGAPRSASLLLPSIPTERLHVVAPDTVMGGQEFSVAVSTELLHDGPAEIVVGWGEESIARQTQSGIGMRRVEWFTKLMAPLVEGEVAMHVRVGAQSWVGSIEITGTAPLTVVPAGGIFPPGEHVLQLPVDGSHSGFRCVGAGRVADFPAQLLAAGGEEMLTGQTPPAAALHVLAALKGATTPEAQVRLRQQLEGLVAEMAAMEREGGWAWENIAISPGLLTSAFTWRVLLEAKQAGAVVSDRMLARAGAFVMGRYAGIGATDFERKATVLHAMAIVGKADFSLLSPLYRVRDSLSAVALAKLCMAFIAAGRTEESGELLALLFKSGTRSAGRDGEALLSWPGSKGVAGLNDATEATAAVLWCAAKLKPEAPETKQTALWLLQSTAATLGGWTRSRGQAMQALAEWSAAQGAGAASEVTLLADGKEIDPCEGARHAIPADGRLTIRVVGAAAAVVAVGVEKRLPETDPVSWEYPKAGGRHYLATHYTNGGKPLEAPSTSPVIHAVQGQRVKVLVKLQTHPDASWRAHSQFLMVEEELPAGFVLLESSLTHNADKLEREGQNLRFYYGPGVMENISYEMVALLPGTWLASGSVIADPYDPLRCRRAERTQLTIMPSGAPSRDTYVLNKAERLELAESAFHARRWDQAWEQLMALSGKQSLEVEREVTRMKLWILTEKGDGDQRALIDAFELLTERHPSCEIPFEKLLRVGAAYRKLGEYERAAAVARAALDGAFLSDAGLGAALEDAGDYMAGMAMQEELWRRFPDSKDVQESLSGLAQSYSLMSPNAEKVKQPLGAKKLRPEDLLNRSRELLERYLTVYPDVEQVQEVAFSLVNTYFSLKDYAGVVSTATAGAGNYPGKYADSFKYMTALGWFWQGDFSKALAAAQPVAESDSKDRDYARYILAQVYHAQGQVERALLWYRQVKGVYPDAADAIASFEEKILRLPETTVCQPGQPVKLSMDYRNLKEGSLQLYKVDLMKLYLRERSLNDISRVNLAGITPEVGESFSLGSGEDYTMRQMSLDLKIKDVGAYLAIVRGDDLFTSGLVIISPLRLEVKEDPSGAVRVHVIDTATGRFLPGAAVKALGSASAVVQNGVTDPRGLVELGDLAGKATIIVQQEGNAYAIHRGTNEIGSVATLKGPPDEKSAASLPKPLRKLLEKNDYLGNINGDNFTLQNNQRDKWDMNRRSNKKGVKAQDALKK